MPQELPVTAPGEAVAAESSVVERPPVSAEPGSIAGRETSQETSAEALASATGTLTLETGGLPDVTPPGPARVGRVPWWPFELYAIAWLSLVAYAALGLSHREGAAPALLQESYPWVLLSAVVLTAAGPAVSILAWLGGWLANGRAGPGMLTAALIRGALLTFFGVLAWWGTLTLIDAIRLGVVR